jgi:membrane-associated phospholipid phosphatase
MTDRKNTQIESSFSPYGLLNNDYLIRLNSTNLYPADWTGIQGASGSLESQWIKWRSITLEIIHDVLWPAWDRNSRQWVGKRAHSMLQLTETDFALLNYLQQQKPMQLDRQINSPVSGRSTHRELFQLEDDNASNFGTYFNEYDSGFPPLLLKRLPGLILAGFAAKSHTTSLQIKTVLERPRAYQMALLLGHNDYFYLPAASADTPSMCSGHCMEGLLAVGAAMERFLLNNEKIAPSWPALEQYAADIGDRRVMAGVHYPSDSLCSWLITMRLANHVYRVPAVKQKLWMAIQRSFIFETMVYWMKKGKGEIYKPAFKALEYAAK